MLAMMAAEFGEPIGSSMRYGCAISRTAGDYRRGSCL